MAAISLFISYKRENIAFAEELQRRVDTAGIGIKCWYDTYIPPGDDWKESIDAAIEGSDGILVVVTTEALKFPYVTYEWSYAMGMRKRVIPIILEIPNPKEDGIELHPKLDQHQAIFFNTGKVYDWDYLIQKLKQVVQQERIPPELKLAEARIYDADRDTYTPAMYLLVDHEHPRATEILAEVAQGQSPDHSRMAAIMLVTKTKNQDRRAIPGLIRFFNTDLDAKQAVKALIAMDSPEVAHTIWDELKNITQEERRRRAVDALSQLMSPAVVPMLIEILQSQETNVEGVIEALGRHADRQALPSLLEYINKHAPEMNLPTKIKAVQAIEKIADPAAINPLIEIFKKHADVISRSADPTDLCNLTIHTIAAIGGQSTIPQLHQLTHLGRGRYQTTIEATIRQIPNDR